MRGVINRNLYLPGDYVHQFTPKFATVTGGFQLTYGIPQVSKAFKNGSAHKYTL